MSARVQRFEELIAWQKARLLTAAIYRITSEGENSSVRRSLWQQMMRIRFSEFAKNELTDWKMVWQKRMLIFLRRKKS